VTRIGFSQRLELRQSQTQTLVMTPQLQQAIRMLQLSNLELSDLVDAEVQQNPLLERREHGVAEAAPDRPDPGAEPSGPAAPEGSAGDSASEFGEDWRALSGEEGDGSADFWDGTQPWIDPDRTLGAVDRREIEHAAWRPRTLREHVLEQIGTDLADPGDRVIAQHLLDLLDEAGYLTGSVDPIVQRLGCDLARIEQVLARVQQFDPAGIFARDLAECLALQLRERNRLDPAMQALLQNLPLLAARNIAALTRLCRVDAEDIADMIAEVRSLDPRPGLVFDPPLAPPVIPDILMRALAAGGWAVELNNETLPRVLVNNRYLATVRRAKLSSAEKDYLSERLQAANWLVKSLHQRATTILKVAAEIVRQQEAFFRRGVPALRPLVLRDIADAIGMHESTVSRVTSNKYIATPRGLYALKYFFTSAIPASAGGGAHSAAAVRDRIRGLIESEPAADTLSDQRIVELLRREGVDIARRTVAKYREAMRIPSSVLRRRDKLLEL
jgi:RNA polymerase sigma-54 factor